MIINLVDINKYFVILLTNNRKPLDNLCTKDYSLAIDITYDNQGMNLKLGDEK